MIALALAVLLVSYTEPTTYTNGAPLVDLDHCNVYVGGLKLPATPATSPAGGGRVTVAVGAPEGDYAISVTCTTAAEVEGEFAGPVSVWL